MLTSPTDVTTRNRYKCTPGQTSIFPMTSIAWRKVSTSSMFILVYIILCGTILCPSSGHFAYFAERAPAQANTKPSQLTDIAKPSCDTKECRGRESYTF